MSCAGDGDCGCRVGDQPGQSADKVQRDVVHDSIVLHGGSDVLQPTVCVEDRDACGFAGTPGKIDVDQEHAITFLH